MSMLTCQVSDNQWSLSGGLVTDAVAKQYRQLKRLRPASGQWHIDCRGIEKIDSAGLSFLVDCARYAQQHSVTLTVNSLPKASFSLIEVQGLSEVFKTFYKDQ